MMTAKDGYPYLSSLVSLTTAACAIGWASRGGWFGWAPPAPGEAALVRQRRPWPWWTAPMLIPVLVIGAVLFAVVVLAEIVLSTTELGWSRSRRYLGRIPGHFAQKVQFDETAPASRPQAPRFRAGEWVEVLSAAEIAATLDDRGELEGLPFMPEMLAFCGRRLRVHRRADKTCVEGFGLRRLGGAVFLAGARCDGAFHDGCQRGCLTIWKEAWLRPAGGETRRAQRTEPARAPKTAPTRAGQLYACQSTALADATRPLPVRKLWFLLDDLKGGELSLVRLGEIAGRTLVNRVRKLFGRGDLGELRGPGLKAPAPELGLRAGEWVRIKPAAEIAATLGLDGKNRGLTFEPEMTGYAGKVFQVEAPVERIIHEESGRMVHLKHTVVLKGLVCEGRCTKNCPRSNPLYWREDWLERLPERAAVEIQSYVNGRAVNLASP